jgi:hypothetical protein
VHGRARNVVYEKISGLEVLYDLLHDGASSFLSIRASRSPAPAAPGDWPQSLLFLPGLKDRTGCKVGYLPAMLEASDSRQVI